MQKVLIIGVVLGGAAYLLTFALHLLNASSDVAVAGGYLILLLMLGALVETTRRYRKSKQAQ